MEYRHLPHGDTQERLSVLGLGMGGIQGSPESEINERGKGLFRHQSVHPGCGHCDRRCPFHTK